MKPANRHTSRTSVLVVAILLCSIVCSVTNVFGRVFLAEPGRILKKESISHQLTTQLAEKAESETKTDTETKHHTPFFVIQSVVELFGFETNGIRCSGVVYAARMGRFRDLVPLYLTERNFRI